MYVRKVLSLAVLTALTLFGGAFVSAPNALAGAHSFDVFGCGSNGLAKCGYIYVYAAHDRVHACDLMQDSYGLRAYYWLEGGGSGYVDDGNGAAQGCGGVTPGRKIIRVQGCSKQPVYKCTTVRPVN